MFNIMTKATPYLAAGLPLVALAMFIAFALDVISNMMVTQPTTSERAGGSGLDGGLEKVQGRGSHHPDSGVHHLQGRESAVLHGA